MFVILFRSYLYAPMHRSFGMSMNMVLTMSVCAADAYFTVTSLPAIVGYPAVALMALQALKTVPKLISMGH